MKVRNIDGSNERVLTQQQLSELNGFALQRMQVELDGRWVPGSRFRPVTAETVSDGVVALNL